jgi:hypothetical protein
MRKKSKVNISLKSYYLRFELIEIGTQILEGSFAIPTNTKSVIISTSLFQISIKIYSRSIIGSFAQRKRWIYCKSKHPIDEKFSLIYSTYTPINILLYIIFKFSRERTQTVQYLLHQREKIDLITNEKQTVKIISTNLPLILCFS